MANVIEYQIVSGGSTSELEEIVNEMIQEGWEPYGGVAISVDKEGSLYVQAMVVWSE